MAADLNSVSVVARLARDPELRTTGGGTSVCELRVAFNNSRKNGQTGAWEDVGNFMNVTVWGNQGESIARLLKKGARVAIHGRLQHRTWQDQAGNNREAHSIIADSVQFLDPKPQNGQGGQPAARAATPPAQPATAAPATDDDIPF
jgi:single-strand DNA-binding protein